MPRRIRVDNCSQFTSKELDLWAYANRVILDFSRPGKPTDNAFIEAFNSRFRLECLNQHWFLDLADARRTIEAWRVHYNTVRPHSSLGFLSPELFRMAGETSCGKAGRSATLENSSSFPLSHSHDGGDNSTHSSLSNWT